MTERDSDALIGHVDNEVRERDERGHDHDHDRCDREEQRVVRPSENHGHHGDDDEDHGHREQSHERTVKAPLLMETGHWPFHTGFRRSMKAATPSRKSSLV